MKKQLIILTLIILSHFANAIGDSCSVAIPMPYSANSNISGNLTFNGQTWFSFVPLTSEVQIKLTNLTPNGGHVHDLILFEGFCNPKNFIVGKDSRNDSVLKIQMHDLVVGLPYYILVMGDRTECIRCTAGGAMFNLNVKSIAPPVQTTTNNVVFLNGQPSHIKNEVIIRISKLYLKMNAINNLSQQDKPITVFVDPAMIQSMANKIYNGDNIGLGKLHFKRVYPTLTANDTISISRQGQQVRIPDFWETFILTIPDTMKMFKTCRILSDINGIRYAEPNCVFVNTSVPNDPFYSAFQPNLHPTSTWPNAHINIEGAWDIETGKSFIKVGVYDTGIDQTHSELNGGKVVSGYNYYANTALSAPYDIDDHGTACAGIIGAFRNNNNNIAGIAGGDASTSNTGCSLVDMKIAKNSSTYSSLSTISNAILSGATSSPNGQGLHIMNHSWGSQQNSVSLRQSIQNATQNGVIIVVAKGNFPDTSPIDNLIFPACLQDEMVICVGASGTNGEWKTVGNGNISDADDNNFQSMIKNGVDLIAPGTNTLVRTTKATTNGFMTFHGTSAAAPHVSGVAALMLSHVNQPFPTLSNFAIEDVENILQLSATDKAVSPQTVGYDDYSGFGLLNAGATMNNIKSPEYKVQHFGVNQNASTSKVQTKVATHIQIVLTEPFQGLPAGTYYGDKYEETFTLNYTLSSPNDVIITAWPRFSSTLGWFPSGPQTSNNFCQLVSYTNNQAILKTWSYNILYDQLGHILADPWYPSQNNQKVAFSLYTYNQTLVGLHEKNKDGSSILNVYPNPATNNVTVNLNLLKSQSISVDLYDIQGKLIKSVTKGKISEGSHAFNVPLIDVAEGVYIFKVVSEDASFEKKLVVIK
ncbi:MAG: S8 family peptidase [Bacteroidetes bacterium]|nr:S8 family peptidase [Bacteroidota bacterium]